MFCSGVPPLIGLMRAALTQCWLLGGTARKAETAACGAGDPSETCAAHVVAAQKKSQSVLHQSVARRLYKDRSLTMGRQKRRPTIVARRPITLARSPAPAVRGADIGHPTRSGNLFRGSCEANDSPGFRSRRKKGRPQLPERSRGATSWANNRMELSTQSTGIWPPTFDSMMMPVRPSSSRSCCSRASTMSGVP